MGTEENKALVRRFVEEFWNRGDLAAADELMASDVTIHAPVDGGLSGLKAFNAMFRSAFPDWCATAQELVAEGDLVAERWTGRGRTGASCWASRPPAGRWRCRASSSTASPTAGSRSSAGSSTG